MARPGGWNKDGIQFNDTGEDLRFYLLGSQGVKELPLDAVTSQETFISVQLNEARIQLLESRDALLPTPRAKAQGVTQSCPDARILTPGRRRS
jgi:hypothetical protein